MTSRRDFLATSAAALVASPLMPPGVAALLAPRYDVVIRGGTVFDGTGHDGVEADVAIAAGRIVAVKPKIPGKGAREIDARGKAVAPGFIDIHSHGDGNLWLDPHAESVVRQGITTIVVGQDGSSRAPVDPSEEDDRIHQYTDFAALWKAIATLRPAVNVATMIGLGSVRANVIGMDDRPATEAELKKMAAIVERALVQGACGASSGLEYTPGAFAPVDELVALCKPLARRGLPYATHMRNEDDRLLESIDESIQVARLAGCPLQISHLKTQGPRNWGKLDDAFKRIVDSRSRGVDAAFDRYPYVAYQTGLTNLFPVWSRDGGTDAFLGRLRGDSATKIRDYANERAALIGGWHNVQITRVANDDDRPAEGMRLDDWAKARGFKSPYEAAVALLDNSKGNVGMVGFAMSEENLERILAHPVGMVCSDGGSFATEGPAHVGRPHPRGFGTFPRVLGRYVRERKALSLGQAIWKMTALPASRINVRDRGKLLPRMIGDVVVFDPAMVADKATFEDPFQYPAGIDAVLVNGRVALLDGERLDGKRRVGVGVKPAGARS